MLIKQDEFSGVNWHFISLRKKVHHVLSEPDQIKCTHFRDFVYSSQSAYEVKFSGRIHQP
jgi:hypothetical protein